MAAITKDYDKRNNVSNIRLKRVMGLIIDEVIWYAIYVIVFLILFLAIKGIPTISGNHIYYQNASYQIKTSTAFTITYGLILIIYEVIVPMISNGKTISKKILKLNIQSKNNSKVRIAARGIIKLIILNPYWFVGYLIFSITHLFNNAIYTRILFTSFAACILIAFINKEGKGLHDILADTVIKESDGL